ncbi:MAG: cytochrome c biogenesis protein CcsA [Coriobacteriia bacterium]|nr:cytochrome c biogenesis protein CcsA [Coriobacteriia bacterium]
MNLSSLGILLLYLAVASCLLSLPLLLVNLKPGNKAKQKKLPSRNTRFGHYALFITTATLTLSVALLVFCFLSENNTIAYVAQYRARSDSPLQWLYLLSGLWGGRSGSLLFWAWLISIINLLIAAKNIRHLDALDNAALAVSQLVLLAFLAMLVFSSSNMPFTPTPAAFMDSQGNLINQAANWGMNPLLEHWAMVLHPPMLFVGYAGMTIPFAYAIASLIVDDKLHIWVDKCHRIAVVAWLFLGAGIGLGAVWAYVVLGWGGYWGWDPVENASLLSWLISVAMIHTFTMNRQRNSNWRWSVLCACLNFSCVILGTFITRSGIVQSVHSFESDRISLVLFGLLIIMSPLAGAAGLLLRRKSLTVVESAEEADELLTKDMAFFFNNAIMVIVTVLIAYLTLAPALPAFLPFGGNSISADFYNAIARPLGVIYCIVMAVCPLLSWRSFDKRRFWQRAKIPTLLAAIMFVGLSAFFFVKLHPMYLATIKSGGDNAQHLVDAGPRWYYFGLTLLGFATASLLCFNSLMMLVNLIKTLAATESKGVFAVVAKALTQRASSFGGFLSHLGMAVILVGLIGSSMYVYEQVDYISYQHETDTTSEVEVSVYTLRYVESDSQPSSAGRSVNYSVTLDVYRNGNLVGRITPSIDIGANESSRKFNAAVLSSATEDLFVVFQGLSMRGEIVLDVRVIPLINHVWFGFAILMTGTAVATLAQRRQRHTVERVDSDESDTGDKN